MTSSAVAGIATFVMFSTVAALGLTGPSSRSARQALTHPRLAIAERLAPTPNTANDVPETIVVSAPSLFAREQKMGIPELMKRWEPFIKQASKRFKVPADWIREVIRLESGGRTMLAENMPMVSNRGALGLMQLLPSTYADMRAQYGLGKDPFNPHDNIFAGAAYLSWLRSKYGYPAMLAAYNTGPGNYEARTARGAQLPTETQNYVTAATLVLDGNKSTIPNPVVALATPAPATTMPAAALVTTPPTQTATAAPIAATFTGAAQTISSATAVSMAPIAPPTSAPAPAPTPAAGSRQVSLASRSCSFTESGGSQLNVGDCGDVTNVRAPLAEESLPGVQAILSVGATLHTVRESVDAVRRIVRSHGGRI